MYALDFPDSIHSQLFTDYLFELYNKLYYTKNPFDVAKR